MKLIFVKFTVVVVLMLILACESERSSENGSIAVVEIDNSREHFISSPKLLAQNKIIIIPKAQTYQIGNFFTEFHSIGENLLLVDRRVSEVTCINEDGDLIWKPIPPSPGVDRYEVIGSVDVDKFNREIYIEERMSGKMDVFDFKGKYVRTIQKVASFIEAAVIGENKLLYDISYRPQGGVNIDSTGPMRFLFRDGESLRYTTPMLAAASYNSIPVNNNDRFNRINGKLQHRRPFGNVIYQIDDEANAKPVLSFSFARDFEFLAVSANPNVENTWQELFEKGFPLPSVFVFDEDKNRLYCNYQVGEDFYFSCVDNGKQIINPSKYYDLGGEYVRAPRIYSDGVFYQQMYRYEYEYIQAAFSDQLSKEDVQSGLEKLRTIKGDNDDVFIIATVFG
ncbi:6-bladed beta-propeller [Neolewinella aurantiaca]|uniref:6-bladed beta-propeller n=1 Tax=Neolewinella aurantiaca TaxID=2602767 RepID=A0A5C7F322_9BACT|nr:6-bladed beta-propeller [Neolewinella aurantiaca]TXF81584.1 6-bladed beta-propeller [Neolewinella aurantiaca]